MRTPLKAAIAILAAAAMLSIPSLSNADDIQRSHPENTQSQILTTPSTPDTKPENPAQPQTPTTSATPSDGSTSSTSSAPKPATPQSQATHSPARATPQLPSTQDLCDTTVRSLGPNVTGQLTDIAGGCQLNISAGNGGGTLDSRLFRAFPGLDTTVTKIAFVGPNTTMLPINCSNLFSQLPILESLDFSDFADTSGVTDMSSMFYHCTKLTNLGLGSKFDTSNVTNMDYMFRELLVLPNLDLGSKFDTSNVGINRFNSMSGMFYDCEKLKGLDLGSKFNTQRVMQMDIMFKDCYELKSLNLGNKFDTRWCTSMAEMFSNCRKLESLNLGNTFYTTSVSQMFNMFRNCSSLTSLDLGDHFNTSNAQAVYGMFDGCKSLTNLNLGDNFDTSSVDDYFGTWAMFKDCSSLTSLDLGDKFEIGQLGTYNLFNVPNHYGTAEMFSGDTNLTNLNLGDHFDTSHVPNMAMMFKDCSSLTNLSLGSKFNTSSALSMEEMFAGDTNLTNLDLSGFDTSMVNGDSPVKTQLPLDNFDEDYEATSPIITYDIEGMFAGDTKLTNLDLSGFDTNHVPGMANMFKDCSSLTNLDLGVKFNTGAVTDMSDMLSGCDKLKQFEIGKDTKLASTVDLPAANWVQLEVPGTDSAHVNKAGVIHYTQVSLETRTNSPDTARVGTYVRIANPNKLTLEPATTLPHGTSVINNTPIIQYSEVAKGTDVPVRDYNGAELADPIASLVALDGTSTIPDNPFTISGCPEAGCTFKSWAKKSNGTGTTYQPGDQIDLSHGDITLYATWKVNKPKPSKPSTSPSATQNHNSATTATTPGRGVATEIAPAIPSSASPVTFSAASPVAAPIVGALAAANPGAAANQAGRDTNSTPSQRPATPKKINPKCQAIAWRTGDIHPAAYRCNSDEQTTSFAPDATRQAPLWIFLLLLLITLFAFYALSRRDEFDIVRHRAMQAEE
ncbi:BspA family leucine-rich repeat surface protein [Bifidobacterium sp. ESL0690]|uniref:BspA family leucine-rich repeat surface protein n=1 Tax=Bifidobacterium sp. ESL0690 TaxID=2983214 RepID=UPI0023F8024E|nr:BspA family leucine-rich repeat surface protein [Bifidobacterium sp. ESL0690]WEV46607.1 BspA family leucine-rich repeat surface protein [Bifidobacterium sp. ESL0690]